MKKEIDQGFFDTIDANRAQGVSWGEIAELLNSLNYRAKNGGPWTESNLHKYYSRHSKSPVKVKQKSSNNKPVAHERIEIQRTENDKDSAPYILILCKRAELTSLLKEIL